MDRSIDVKVNARLQGFIAELRKGKQAAQEFRTGVTNEIRQTSSEFTTLGTGAAAAGAIGALGLGVMINKASEFDQAMSFVQAANHETAGTMKVLRDAALDAGAKTVFSATESANAIEELSKAGLTTSDILGGALTGALDMAAASGLGVARAAEITATTLKQFNLEGSEAGHVADVLAAGAGKALGSVDDLANGLKFVGPVAASMNVSLEETTGVLALFAQNGIIGEQAGTSLRGMLSSLTSPSRQARNEIERLGITLYDSRGNFLGLQNAAGELERAYSGMSDEQRDFSLGVLFGNEQITAARVLYGAGAEGVRDWTKAVDDSGYAAETARIRLDNLRGDVDQLGGALDTALIKTGQQADDTLRGLTQAATGVLNVYNELPDSAQGGAMALGVIATAAALAGGAFFVGAPKVVEFRDALGKLREDAPKTMRVVGAIGKGFAWLAVATTAISVLNAVDESLDGVGVSAEDLQNRLETQGLGGAFTKAFEGVDTGRLSLEDLGSTIDTIADSWDTRWAGVFGEGMLTAFDGGIDGSDKMRDSFERLGEQLATLASEDMPAAQQEFARFVETNKLTEDQVMSLLELMPEWRNALVEHATQLGITADAETIFRLATEESIPVQETAADTYMATAGEVQGLQDKLRSLIDTINEANGVGQDAVSANASYQQSLADVKAYIDNARNGVEGYTLSLDENTAEGAANMDMLAGLARDGQAAAAAQFEVDQKTMGATRATEAYKRRLQESRDAVLQRARDLGATDAQLEFIADHIAAIPDETEWELIADTAAAQSKLEFFHRTWNGRTITMRVNTDGSVTAPRGVTQQRADGGEIRGPGGPRDDKVLIAASNGEHMLSARDVAAMGGHGNVYAWRQGLHQGGGLRRYADGGGIDGRHVRYAGPGFAGGAPTTVRAEVSLVGQRLALMVDGRQIEGVIVDVAEQRIRGYDRNQMQQADMGYRGEF